MINHGRTSKPSRNLRNKCSGSDQITAKMPNYVETIIQSIYQSLFKIWEQENYFQTGWK